MVNTKKQTDSVLVPLTAQTDQSVLYNHERLDGPKLLPLAAASKSTRFAGDEIKSPNVECDPDVSTQIDKRLQYEKLSSELRPAGTKFGTVGSVSASQSCLQE